MATAQMSNGNKTFQKNTIEWLLERQNPSVRYFALCELLGKEENDPQVIEAKAAIPTSSTVAKIFSKQNPKGYWEDPLNPYLPKYKATYWQVMILGQLGMDKGDLRVQNAVEFTLSLQSQEGAFSAYTKENALEKYEWMQTRTHLKEKLQPTPQVWARSLVFEHQYSCLTGNLCAAMLRLGYGRDPRVKKALDWLVKIQNQDGGWLCPYWKAHINDRHGCFYGTICALEALSEVPEEDRPHKMNEATAKGSEFLLMHRLYKADHHKFQVINRKWLNLGFPWFADYNIFRGLVVLTKLGYMEDERLRDAVDVLIRKRMPDGTWLMEATPTGRMHVNIETAGKPSKWITLNALRVLKRLNKT